MDYAHFFTHPLYLMFASILVLFLGPLIHITFRGSRIVRDIIDGFTIIMIILLVAMFILPHTIHDIGFFAIIMMLIGLFLPSVFEKLYHKVASKIHYATIFMVMCGIAVHAFMDGVALLSPHTHHHVTPGHSISMLPVAVILHRLPVGLAIWTILRPIYGNGRAIIMLLTISIATVAGVSYGTWLTHNISHAPFGYFEALIAGLLLHILFHRHDPYEHHSCEHCHHEQKHKHNHETKIDFKWGSGIGALLGFAVIAAIYSSAHVTTTHPEHASKILIFFNLAMVSAPALIIAYLAAGLINIFLPQSSVNWLQQGSEIKQAIRGMLFGLPLPICSCGVVPIYRSLVKKGIPLSAGLAFFIATPELGIDAILITIPLLGTQFATIRLLAAAIVALLVGAFVGMIFSKHKHETQNISDHDHNQTSDPKNFWQKIKTGLWIGFADMVDHTAPWILFGLAIAAAAQPYLESSRLLYSIPKIYQVPLFAFLGMPIYVCASGITPFVAVLIYHGVSPGAAIAFMLTGPATNITTIGILSQLHGKKIAITFTSMIIFFSIGIGYFINTFNVVIPKTLYLSQHAEFPAFRLGFFILLLILYAFSLLRTGPQAWARKIISGDVPKM